MLSLYRRVHSWPWFGFGFARDEVPSTRGWQATEPCWLIEDFEANIEATKANEAWPHFQLPHENTSTTSQADAKINWYQYLQWVRASERDDSDHEAVLSSLQFSNRDHDEHSFQNSAPFHCSVCSCNFPLNAGFRWSYPKIRVSLEFEDSYCRRKQRWLSWLCVSCCSHWSNLRLHVFDYTESECDLVHTQWLILVQTLTFPREACFPFHIPLQDNISWRVRRSLWLKTSGGYHMCLF